MLCLSGFELYSRWVPLNSHGKQNVIIITLQETVPYHYVNRKKKNQIGIHTLICLGDSKNQIFLMA